MEVFCCGSWMVEGGLKVQEEEALEVHWRLQMAMAAGVRKIVLECDKLSVVNALKYQPFGARSFFLNCRIYSFVSKKL